MYQYDKYILMTVVCEYIDIQEAQGNTVGTVGYGVGAIMICGDMKLLACKDFVIVQGKYLTAVRHIT